MKKLWLAFFLVPYFVMAQDSTGTKVVKDTSYWKTGTTFNFNVAQAAYSNWAAGGQNSIAWTAINSGFIEYKKDKVNFNTSLDVAYGMTRLGRYSDDHIRFRKTDDKLVFLTRFSYGLKKAKISALLDFRSQIANGFNYPFPTDSAKALTSRFLAPAFVILGTGVEYTPNANFYIFYSPVTVKGTIVDYQPFADAGQFGVRAAIKDEAGNITTPGRNSRFEFGSYLNAKYKKDLSKNITLTTGLTLFEAYFREQKDTATGAYKNVFNGNIDVFWDATLLMKVNKYITASIATSLIYDDDIRVFRSKYADDPTNPKAYGPGIQFREVIAIGFAAKLRSRFAK